MLLHHHEGSFNSNHEDLTGNALQGDVVESEDASDDEVPLFLRKRPVRKKPNKKIEKQESESSLSFYRAILTIILMI